MGNSNNWNEQAELVWDSRADFWHERSKNMWESGSRKAIIPFAEQYVEKGSEVLDVGCGDGYGSYLLKKAGYTVTGVDLSQEMIVHAQKSAPNSEITFLKANVNDLPFRETSFDALLAINVLEWTEDPLHALKEMRRVTKRGGHLCVGILGPTAGPRANSFPRFYGENAICNTMMPWELKKLAKEIGLHHVDGIGVHKKDVNTADIENLPLELKQALSFMWVYVFEKV